MEHSEAFSINQPSTGVHDGATVAINVLQTIDDEGLLVAVPSEGQDDLMSMSHDDLGNDSSMAESGGVTPKPVKHRPTFTGEQITSMEKIFSQRQYLSPMERETLAGNVGLSPQQVRVWFQNRRQKVKQFLTQRQIRSNQSLQNGEKQEDNSSESVITAQQLSTNIDPILQMLLPKIAAATSSSNEEDEIKKPEGERGEGGEGDDNKISEDKDDGMESIEDSSNAPPNLNLSPSQVSLTPFLLPLTGATPTIQLTTGAQGGNITIPAIQLLQSLISSSLPVGKIKSSPIKAQMSGGGSGISIPLKAQSPTPIEDEGTEIKSEESLPQPPPPSQDTTLLPSIQQEDDPISTSPPAPSSSSKPDADPSPLQTADTNTVLTTVSSEILAQLLGLTASGNNNEGLKWNINVSPSQSGSISGGSVTATPTGITIDIPRRKRQVFSGIQTTELEKQFESCAYIDSKERDKLAEKLGLHPDQIKVWFQNRRTKRSRQAWRQQKGPLEQ